MNYLVSLVNFLQAYFNTRHLHERITSICVYTSHFFYSIILGSHIKLFGFPSLGWLELFKQENDTDAKDGEALQGQQALAGKLLDGCGFFFP